MRCRLPARFARGFPVGNAASHDADSSLQRHERPSPARAEAAILHGRAMLQPRPRTPCRGRQIPRPARQTAPPEAHRTALPVHMPIETRGPHFSRVRSARCLIRPPSTMRSAPSVAGGPPLLGLGRTDEPAGATGRPPTAHTRRLRTHVLPHLSHVTERQSRLRPSPMPDRQSRPGQVSMPKPPPSARPAALAFRRPGRQRKGGGTP